MADIYSERLKKWIEENRPEPKKIELRVFLEKIKRDYKRKNKGEFVLLNKKNGYYSNPRAVLLSGGDFQIEFVKSEFNFGENKITFSPDFTGDIIYKNGWGKENFANYFCSQSVEIELPEPVIKVPVYGEEEKFIFLSEIDEYLKRYSDKIKEQSVRPSRGSGKLVV